MDSYIKTIINGIKEYIIFEVTRLNKIARNAQSTADTAQSTADTAKRAVENKVDGFNPVFSGSFSQNRKAETTVGADSHAEGLYTTATGQGSHAEGNNTTADGHGSHAEGIHTTATGQNSHAEGNNTTAAGENSHAEGFYTTAAGENSHAEGFYTTAAGENSHAEGNNTTASGDYSHAEGRYNIEDTTGQYAHIVGNGTAYERSNANTLDWSGVGWFAGGLKVGGTGQDDEAAVDVALKTDIPNTAPVVFTDESGSLVNANGETAGAEEIYNTLLSGVVYVKKNDVYQVVQNFLYEEGPKITLVIQDHIGSDGITRYEVT